MSEDLTPIKDFGVCPAEGPDDFMETKCSETAITAITAGSLTELLKTARATLEAHSVAHNQFAASAQAQIEASMKKALQLEGAIMQLEELLKTLTPPQ